jgi:hypothetical protein
MKVRLMRKPVSLILFLAVLSIVVSACGTPPPLKSDKYLDDNSLITENPCGPPCFRGITVGQTTYTDALTKIQGDTAFTGITKDENPSRAAWTTTGGEACCQIVASAEGLIDAIVIKLAPKITVKQLIEKYKDPTYVTPVDYSAEESALALIWPDKGMVIWVLTGDANSSLDESDPVVASIYLNPASFPELLKTATLQGWNGYQAYNAYKTQTPVVTPAITATPG